MKVIAIANQKGGVAKTTTAVNLCAGLAHTGYETLLIDLDAQANATQSLPLISEDVTACSVAELLSGSKSISDVTQPICKHLSFIPSHIKLAKLEPTIQGALDAYRLRDALERASADFVVLDCPPSLGALTTNALVAATHVIVPVTASYYGLNAVADFMETMQVVQRRINKKLRLLGILITIYDSRPIISQDVLNVLQETYGDAVLNTRIAKNIRLDEAASAKQSIFEYDPASRGAADYQALLEEVLAHVKA